LTPLLDIVWLTLKLAATTTVALLIIATPLAWWLARSRGWWVEAVAAVVALPIVLPPTVLGFYLLLAMGPDSPLMAPLQALGVRTLAFTFEGLVIGSIVYSLPFAVQPLRNAFEAMGPRPMEAAATLGAGPFDAFFSVAAPLARPGFVVAAVLAFAHTLGEFGVVLMIGGGVPGETEVLSIEMFRLVEALEWEKAHLLAGGLVIFAFVTVLGLLVFDRRTRRVGR
jgi:molybdate transport system permease protein